MNIRNVVIGLIVSALVAGVVVSCGGGSGGSAPAVATFSVSGNVTGSTAATAVKLNGGSDVALTSAGGAFSFTAVPDGTTFNVQVVNGTDKCAVSASGAGKLNGANVTGVTVTCSTPVGTATVVRTARPSGAQENPLVASSGTGTGGLVFNPNSTVVTGGVTLFGITTSDVRLFQDGVGTPIVQLGTAGDGHTFFIPTGTTLTGGQATALSAGNLYFDVFTSGHPFNNPGDTGEIRGQINVQGGVRAAVATIDFAQESAPVGGADPGCTGDAAISAGSTTTVTAVGQGTFVVDSATKLIVISYMTHNVATSDLSHIHDAPLGASGTGPVIINFVPGPTLAYPTDPTAPVTSIAPAAIGDFDIGYLYFNVHSTNDHCQDGEIRGNMVPVPGI
jgi:hypothetical protein